MISSMMGAVKRDCSLTRGLERVTVVDRQSERLDARGVTDTHTKEQK